MHNCLFNLKGGDGIIEVEAVKIKLSVLWLFWIIAFLIHFILGLFEPGVIEKAIAGEMAGLEITPEVMLAFAIMLLVPLVMAVLSITVRDPINRWANVILGIFYTGLCLVDWLVAPVQPAYAILMYISKIVASALIIWYAWKWQ